MTFVFACNIHFGIPLLNPLQSFYYSRCSYFLLAHAELYRSTHFWNAIKLNYAWLKVFVGNEFASGKSLNIQQILETPMKSILFVIEASPQQRVHFSKQRLKSCSRAANQKHSISTELQILPSKYAQRNFSLK